MKTIKNEAVLMQYLIPSTLPVFLSNLDTNEETCKLALSGIYEEYNKGYKSNETNIKASFTTSYFVHTENHKFLPLVTLVKNLCEEILQKQFNVKLNIQCNNCWGSIYNKGDYAIKHNHFPSILAACVYLDLEDNSSNIFFNDYEIAVSKGSLIIFPGFVNHYVEPTEGKRVVVAMNFDSEGLTIWDTKK